jgi:hypothetical protein
MYDDENTRTTSPLSHSVFDRKVTGTKHSPEKTNVLGTHRGKKVLEKNVLEKNVLGFDMKVTGTTLSPEVCKSVKSDLLQG